MSPEADPRGLFSAEPCLYCGTAYCPPNDMVFCIGGFAAPYGDWTFTEPDLGGSPGCLSHGATLVAGLSHGALVGL